MSLLTPLYLLGLAALALPVVFHLLRRPVKTDLPFSSLLFLKPSPPRLTRRSRIDNWWLLLIRALALACLVFAFSRPLLRQLESVTQTQTGRNIILVVDRSASMNRDGVWQDAMTTLQQIVNQAKPTDQLALFPADNLGDRIVFTDFTTDTKATGDAILQWTTAAQPRWERDRLPNAMGQVVDWLESLENEGQSGLTTELHLISDFQSPVSGEWQQVVFPDSVQVIPHRVSPRQAGNASLMLIESAEDERMDTQVTLRVTNDDKAENSTLNIVDEQGEVLAELKVPPGQSRTVPLTPPGDPTLPWTVRLTGDNNAFDNSLHLPPVASRFVELAAIVDPSTEPMTSWMVQQACQSLPFQEVNWHDLADLTQTDLQSFHALFVMRELDPQEQRLVRDYVEQGGRVVLAMTQPLADDSQAAWGATLTGLGVDGIERIAEGNVEDFLLIDQVDTSVPPLNVLGQSTFRDFSSIHFWRYRVLETDDPANRVVARFENDAPFVLAREVGQGRVLVLTAGWTTDESQLGQNSRFVTLMIQLADLRRLRPPIYIWEIGETPYPDADKTLEFEPVGRSAGQPQHPSDSIVALPGLYRTEQEGRIGYLVSQIPASERQDAQTSPEELRTLGLPLEPPPKTNAAGTQTTDLGDRETEHQQQIWRWLVLAALGLVGLETMLGGVFSRKKPTSTESP